MALSPSRLAGARAPAAPMRWYGVWARPFFFEGRLWLEEAFERAAIPFPQRLVYLRERAPR